jgi:cytochrome P450
LYNGITKQEILSTLEEFIGAGFETVSTTLEWIVLEIAQAEIDQGFPRFPDLLL